MAVVDAPSVSVTSGADNAFALGFSYNPGTEKFHVSYASGMTLDTGLPLGRQVGTGLAAWDLTECDSRRTEPLERGGRNLHVRTGRGISACAGGPRRAVDWAKVVASARGNRNRLPSLESVTGLS